MSDTAETEIGKFTKLLQSVGVLEHFEIPSNDPEQEWFDTLLLLRLCKAYSTDIESKLADALARIAESQKQEPSAYVYPRAYGSGASLCKINKPDDWDDDGNGEWYERPLFAAPIIQPTTEEILAQARAEERERLGKLIHYPECWDTACYETLESALAEIGCSEHRKD